MDKTWYFTVEKCNKGKLSTTLTWIDLLNDNILVVSIRLNF